ncbi:hypothetical protein [Actinomadura sediminis]|uniref:MarR family transcriptional regulator n=1 Tax=Actinomadura sediminis TaxID=1038904 RepID=A0ABW3ET28_9ACTN
MSTPSPEDQIRADEERWLAAALDEMSDRLAFLAAQLRKPKPNQQED